MPRYVLEGEWTGYTSAQRRVSHREVLSASQEKKIKHLHAIVYTDGTSLILYTRELKPREKIEPILGYSQLIREAMALGKSRVLVSELRDN